MYTLNNMTTGDNTTFLSHACYSLRRVLRCRRSVLLPLKHPEVAALQCELVGLLLKAVKLSKSAVTIKVCYCVVFICLNVYAHA